MEIHLAKRYKNLLSFSTTRGIQVENDLLKVMLINKENYLQRIFNLPQLEPTKKFCICDFKMGQVELSYTIPHKT